MLDLNDSGFKPPIRATARSYSAASSIHFGGFEIREIEEPKADRDGGFR